MAALLACGEGASVKIRVGEPILLHPTTPVAVLSHRSAAPRSGTSSPTPPPGTSASPLRMEGVPPARESRPTANSSTAATSAAGTACPSRAPLARSWTSRSRLERTTRGAWPTRSNPISSTSSSGSSRRSAVPAPRRGCGAPGAAGPQPEPAGRPRAARRPRFPRRPPPHPAPPASAPSFASSGRARCRGLRGQRRHRRPAEVDFLWPDLRLAVEVDGYDAHSGRIAFERDRLKVAVLNAQDITVMPVTGRQIRRDPDGVAARLVAALRARAAASRH